MNSAARKSDSQRKNERRGSVEENTGPRFLVIGQVGKPHGVRGDIRVSPHTDNPQRFAWLDKVYIGDVDPRPVRVEEVRFHKSWVLLKLEGYDDRTAAASLRGELLQVPMDQAIPLEENEYFLFELIGMFVFSDAGEELGELVQVIETGANNVFVIKGSRGELLIPDTAEVVVDIDFEGHRMTVHLMEGLQWT